MGFVFYVHKHAACADLRQWYYITMQPSTEEWLEEQGFEYNPELNTWQIETEYVGQRTEERNHATIYCTLAQAEEYRQRGERWM